MTDFPLWTGTLHKSRRRFFLGLVSGVLVVAIGMPPTIVGADGEGKKYGHSPEKKLEKLTKQLQLTKEQQAKILPILQEKHQAMQALQEQMKEARNQAITKIEKELTPDQLETFQQARKNRGHKMKAHKKKHRKGHKKGQRQDRGDDDEEDEDDH